MPRPRRCRWVRREPSVAYFKPAGVRIADAGIVYLEVDEFEALRLSDMEKRSQTDAAKSMGVSQPTFHRLLDSAHEKVARALVEGSAIKIGGGDYVSQEAIAHIRKTKEVKGMEKIAISATTGGLDDMVNPVFGRCPKYVIVEIENKKIKSDRTIDNTAAQMPGGAGIQAAQNVANEGVTAVITGNVGPNALPILASAGVKVYMATGITVKEAVQTYLDGKLQQLSAPTAPGMSPGTGAGIGVGMGLGRGMGRGAGRRMGAGRGMGRGRMGAAGPGGECMCPSCGEVAIHQPGTPCLNMACPKCGTKMIRKI